MGRRIGLPSPKPVPREFAPPEARFWSPLQIARNPLKDSWASDEKSTKAPLPLSYSAATGHQFDFNAAILGATLGGVVGGNGRAGACTKGLQARRIDAIAAQREKGD